MQTTPSTQTTPFAVYRNAMFQQHSWKILLLDPVAVLAKTGVALSVHTIEYYEQKPLQNK